MVSGEVHRFLRRTGAFDWHGRLGEERFATFELLHQFPGVGSQVKPVVGGHTIATQGVVQTFNTLPVEFQARADDQLLVLHHAAAFQNDLVVIRLEGRYTGLDPAHIGGDHRRHGACCLACLENSTAHHGPARLVIVGIGRVDDRNVQQGAACQQAGCNRNTCGTTTDDDHVVAGICLIRGRFATVRDALYQRLHVKAHLLRCFQYVRQRCDARLRQGPHSG